MAQHQNISRLFGTQLCRAADLGACVVGLSEMTLEVGGQGDKELVSPLIVRIALEIMTLRGFLAVRGVGGCLISVRRASFAHECSGLGLSKYSAPICAPELHEVPYSQRLS